MPVIRIIPVDVTIRVRDKRRIYKWIHSVIRSEKKNSGDITIQLCSDQHLLKINQDFLKHDYYTDIITFDYSEGNTVSGELFISLDRVEENAKRYSASFEEELRRVMIHGVLHLCGYGDKTKKEAEMMRKREDQKLKLFR